MLAVGSCVHRGGIALPRAAPVCGSRTALLGSQRFRRRYSHPRSSRQGTVRTMAMETDNASVLVCGGGGVALEVARILKDKGAWVWVLQRSDSRRGDIEGMLATLVKGDAMKKDDVKKAFEQIEDLDVVISTIGGTPANPAADSEGNINLIDAAAEHGVKKFVLVTSIGTGNSKSAPPANVYEVLQPVLLEKEKAEERLKEMGSKMAYTIIRPGGLKSEPATGNGVLTENNNVCGAIHREDVADLVARAAFNDAANNRVFSAVDSEQLYGKPDFEIFEV
eukprot:jgi/Botrbrau1/15533/Bobra.0123s0007.2